MYQLYTIKRSKKKMLKRFLKVALPVLVLALALLGFARPAFNRNKAQKPAILSQITVTESIENMA